ncbi:MAG: thioredoxin domain-containing protein [Sandaracinaceae bacterium]|nr:thioredoxin domain-containing protein [Sandaracinaceae bacterium]
MRQNPLGLVLAIVSVALSGICCISGVGFAMFMATARRGDSSVVEPPPVASPYPAPAYPAPSYPPPTPAPAVAAPQADPTGTLAVGPDNATRGPASAPVTIHVVSEFQCPFCARVEPTLARVDAAYPGQILWVWHDYPLPFHTNAMPAAEAGREVRRQLGDEAFWRFHDLVFENSSQLSPALIEQLASTLPGLDLAAFRTALATHQHEASIRADMALVDAQLSAGPGTPQFLINGSWLRGAQPFERFQGAIDHALGR